MESLLEKLKNLGKKDKNGLRFWERDLFEDRQLSGVALAEMCRQMSFMLGAGITIRSVINVLAESSVKLRGSLRSVMEGILRGESLSRALENTEVFPPFMCNMCRIGEMSDNLPRVMALLADYYEESARNRDEIIAALMYPAVVSVMMLGMILAAVLFVLPNYALVFAASDVPLPVLTRALLAFSDLLITRWWLVLPMAALLIAAFVYFLKTRTFELLMLKISIYRQMVSLHIVQAMALMLQSGQPLPDAVLAVSGIVSNRQISQDLQRLAMGLHEGSAFWMLLTRLPYIDPIVVSMARVGEETGDMAQAFEHAGEFCRHRFTQMSRRLNKLVEPLVTLILGFVLGLVMLSIILPTFAMTDLMW